MINKCQRCGDMLPLERTVFCRACQIAQYDSINKRDDTDLAERLQKIEDLLLPDGPIHRPQMGVIRRLEPEA